MLAQRSLEVVTDMEVCKLKDRGATIDKTRKELMQHRGFLIVVYFKS